MHNYHIKTVITILVSVLTFNAFGQSVKKEISTYRQLKRLTVDSIKTGNYSALAKELSIEDFMSFYIDHGKVNHSKRWGMNGTTVDEVYSDTIYTYFLRKEDTRPVTLYKVKAADMSGIDIADIDGNLIRERFIAEIIPNRDKEEVEKSGCVIRLNFYPDDFEYRYNRTSRQVEVTFNWKVSCRSRTAINKMYKAYYSIDEKTFQN